MKKIICGIVIKSYIPNLNLKIKLTSVLLLFCLSGSYAINTFDIIDTDYSESKDLTIINVFSKIDDINKAEQDFSLNGIVTDSNGQPLLGANIVEKGTQNGTQADFDGKFSINLSNKNAILVVSYLGFLTEEVEVNNQFTINIVLKEDSAKLDEVVVIGYGTQKRKDVTGSIASIETTQIDTRPIASVEEAMQGLVPGLNIAQRASSPGELGTVSIRGLGSITAGTQPLWVIDGFPTDQRNAMAINPADVLSVDILKDASSTAIYGSRGANGVIIITTKSGKSGKPLFNFTVTTGVATAPESERFDVLNAREYVQFHTEKNGGVVPAFIADNWDGTTDTNWQDLIFRSGIFQNYALSASGGNDKVSYLLSGNYIDQEGIVIGEGQKKYSARAKIDFKASDKFTIGINLAPNVTTIGRNSERTDVSDWASLYAQSILMAPILPVHRADGTFSMNSDLAGALPIGNPVETSRNYDFQQTIFQFLGGIYADIEVAKGLNLRSSFSANIGTNKQETIYIPTLGQAIPIGMPAASFFNTGQSQSFDWLNENTVTFKRQIKDHSISVLGGFTLQRNKSESVNASVTELQVPGVRNVNIGNSDNLVGANSKSESSLISYLGRINYGYKDKYLVTATVRTDGSSVFGSNNRYQTFGSGALGWKFSEESFLQNQEFLNRGKLRVSYGTTGSNAIPPFSSKSTLNTRRQSFGSNTSFGVVLGNPGNDFLTWETSEQFDIGLDLGLFKNRLNVVFDYFNNKTKSLLLTKGVVPSSGYSTYLTNIGSMRNKGIELTLNAQVVDTDNWGWSVGGNITTNDQEILDLGGEEEIFNFFGALRRVVGGELQQIAGPRAIGIAGVGDDQSGQPLQTPGAVIYEDVDGDGSISNFLGADSQLLGDTNVDLIYGINTNVRYKNWELSALINGQSGAYVYDFFIIQIGAPFRQTNLSTDYWYSGRYISESQPGDGRTPAANGFDGAVGSVSSLGVQKTDYLRIRNVTLNYNAPKSIAEKLGSSSARIYASVENLHTFTKFVGGNPEARRASAGGPALIGGSQIPSVTDGRELGLNSPPGLPLPRTWTLGINLNF
jgi:TonB-linked SusC/RagA family outer membrane protein